MPVHYTTRVWSSIKSLWKQIAEDKKGPYSALQLLCYFTVPKWHWAVSCLMCPQWRGKWYTWWTDVSQSICSGLTEFSVPTWVPSPQYWYITRFRTHYTFVYTDCVIYKFLLIRSCLKIIFYTFMCTYDAGMRFKVLRPYRQIFAI